MKLFTNINWKNRVLSPSCASHYINNADGYYEYIGAHYCLDPLTDHVASHNLSVFNPKKAAAMYFWYKIADKNDASIIKYFPEYKNCIDKNHKAFNSNYGLYANDGIKRCINELLSNKSSRQACFLINNNCAMSPNSIDKLCTNAIMFFIRYNALYMVVQMRSSNFLTLLPYDMFIFSVWYAKVYNALIRKYTSLETTDIEMQVASHHYYDTDYENKSSCLQSNNLEQIFDYNDICDHNFENILENKLLNFLKS